MNNLECRALASQLSGIQYGRISKGVRPFYFLKMAKRKLSDREKVYWRADFRRINQLPIPNGKREHLPNTTAALWAANGYFSIQADFERKDGIWRCVSSSHSWVKKTPLSHLKNELLKRGFTYSWNQKLDPSAVTVGQVSDLEIAGTT